MCIVIEVSVREEKIGLRAREAGSILSLVKRRYFIFDWLVRFAVVVGICC